MGQRAGAAWARAFGPGHVQAGRPRSRLQPGVQAGAHGRCRAWVAARHPTHPYNTLAPAGNHQPLNKQMHAAPTPLPSAGAATSPALGASPSSLIPRPTMATQRRSGACLGVQVWPWTQPSGVACFSCSTCNPVVLFVVRLMDCAIRREVHAPARTSLFQGFSGSFWRGYFEIAPKAPLFERRRDLYTLYHILNVGWGWGGHTDSWAKLHLGFLGAQAPFVEGGRNVRLCSPVHRRLSCQARGGHRRLLCNCSLPAPTAVCLHSTPTSLAAATTPRCVLAASMLRCWLQGCSVAAGMHLQDWRARDQAELLTAGGRCAKPEANNASVWRKQGHVYCGRRVRSCLALCSYPPRPRASCSG
jgi:hypothetical protein